MLNVRRLCRTSTLALSLASASHAALAQIVPAPQADKSARSGQTTDQLNGVQDIIVTAQRRAESLQKTALTIQVVQSKLLSDAGVTTPNQLTNVVPSLQVSSAGAATSVYLRGVGAYSTTAAQSPAIPYYTDGVYVARSQSTVSEFFDVDRLEVLKGPQGTLYGRNASGGAINILSRRPELNVTRGRADFELGNFGDQTGEVAFNLPVGTTAAIRASGQIVDKGGYTSEGLSDDVHQAGRVKLLWEPTSNVSLLLNGSYGHVGGRGQGWVMLNKDVAGWNPWLDITSPQGQAYVIAHGLPLAFFPGATRPSRPEQARQNLKFWNASAELNVKLGNDVTLTLIPAYRHAEMQYTATFSATYYNGYGYADVPARPETSAATSVEARLSGQTKSLKWVAGLYYYNEDQFQSYSFDSGNASNGASDSTYGTQSYAAFGQATLSLTDHIRAIGGVRYTRDKRSLSDGKVYVISPVIFFLPPTPAILPCAYPATVPAKCLADEYSGNAVYNNVSWKGGFEADVLDDGLLYATVSRGFKAGGFNALSIIGDPQKRAVPFRPEQLTSYEVGFKDRFLSNRLQVSLSGFYWDYKDHQEPYLAFTNAGTLGLVYFNAGSTEIYGGTLDVIARPWAGGTFTGSVEYAKSKYKNFAFDVPSFTVSPTSTGCATRPTASPFFTTIDCSGFQAVRTPAWTGGVRYAHQIEIGSGKLIPTASMTFASSRWLGTEFTPIERAKGYAQFDATLTYQAPHDRFSVTGFVRNISNARNYSTAFVNPVAAAVTANIAAPRTYGARLALNF